MPSTTTWLKELMDVWIHILAMAKSSTVSQPALQSKHCCNCIPVNRYILHAQAVSATVSCSRNLMMRVAEMYCAMMLAMATPITPSLHTITKNRLNTILIIPEILRYMKASLYLPLRSAHRCRNYKAQAPANRTDISSDML